MDPLQFDYPYYTPFQYTGNNPLTFTDLDGKEVVYETYNKKIETICLNGHAYLDTLVYVRDKIHEGHKLLTHPLSGSVKPNETPFKSIVIGKQQGTLDYEGLAILEESIYSAQKFMRGRKTPMWTEKVKNDFRLVDCTIISTAIKSMSGKYIG